MEAKRYRKIHPGSHAAHTMNADTLLSRLQSVRETGSDRWIARCPAHEDRSPSLSIRLLDDGRLLVHCFAGCEALSVVQAIGLSLADLFPVSLHNSDHPPGCFTPERHPFSVTDALRCVASEAMLVSVAADEIARGSRPGADECARLAVAADRIRTALGVTR
jgi:hypothetical protein